MQGGLIMSFCIVYYVCLLQYDFCTDDDEHVGIYQGKFVSRAHDKSWLETLRGTPGIILTRIPTRILAGLRISAVHIRQGLYPMRS